jgi:hypothetical protein
MSESVVISRDDQRSERGTWKPLKTPRGPSATVVCPTCGQVASLDGHGIHADGRVWPSLVCPFGCPFHATVRLEGWLP